jgi:hypothetical protein
MSNGELSNASADLLPARRANGRVTHGVVTLNGRRAAKRRICFVNGLVSQLGGHLVHGQVLYKDARICVKVIDFSGN